MDTITLVAEQIGDGQRLIDGLGRENLPVRTACWVKPIEEDRWSLFLVSPLVDEKGSTSAYGEVYRVLRSLGTSYITASDIRLIGVGDPITRDTLEIQSQHPGRLATRSRRPMLGSLGIEEVYVYPAPLALRGDNAEKRRLKKDVKQVERLGDFLLTTREKDFFQQLVAQGLSEQEAHDWVRQRREKQAPRPPIPAGTVVKTWIAAHWGDNPEDDPNPLLRVEAPDGAQGLTFKDDTEAL